MNLPICQSCGMPMEKPEDFGSADYCSFCFKDGAFTHNLTLPEMIEHLVAFASQMGMPEENARKMASANLPKLKRWQTIKGA